MISALHDEEISIENTYILQKLSSNAEFWIRDSSDHYVIQRNDFINVAKDKEYCNYIEGFIKKIIQSTKK